MATSEIFSRHAKVRFREILWSSLLNSLPEELQRSDSFQWLLRRDQSLGDRAHFEKDIFPNSNYRQLFRRFSQSGECDRETLSHLLQPIINAMLGPVLQSRYEEAIDIAQRWRNAKKRTGWTRMGDEAGNFEKTVAINRKRLHENGTDVSEEQLRIGFKEFLRDALESADREFDDVQAEWRRWENQVKSLRDDATAVEKELGDMNTSSALQYAWLRFSIIRESHAPSGRSSAFEIGPMYLAMIVGMLGDSRHWRHRDPEVAFERIDRLFHTIIDEIKYGPDRRRQLFQLEQKYGTDDPFESYRALKKPVDKQFIRLVEEHRLILGEPSPFLSRWLGHLTAPPGWSGVYADPIPYKTKDNNESIEPVAAWADSAIKRFIADRTDGPPKGWETIDDCCRRCWISGWVDWIIQNLKPQKDRKKLVDQRWTQLAVFEFIEVVRLRLVSQGYRFESLTEDEKARLWKS